MCEQKIFYKIEWFGWAYFIGKTRNRLEKGVDKYSAEEYDHKPPSKADGTGCH